MKHFYRISRLGVSGRLPHALVLSLLLCGFPALLCAASRPDAPPRSGMPSPAVRRLRPPLPPDTLDRDDKLLYMVEHYWDDFDFGDATWLADSASFEQAFADWAYLASFLPADRASRSTGYVVERADVSHPMLMRFAQAAEHYFAGADSPYRNEEALIPILQGLTRAQSAEPAERERFGALLSDADRNRPGMQAAELEGQAADGRRVPLSSLDCDYTLLLFYSPSCPTCRFVEQQIGISASLSALLQQGKLRVYAFYPGSGDEAWRQSLGDMPTEGWSVVCDPDGAVVREGRYVLRATPTLYLLGRGRRVILKDAPLEVIEQWLHEYAGPLSFKTPEL